MKETIEWVITFCTSIEESDIQYYNTCDIIKNGIKESLDEQYGYSEFAGDSRDGDSYLIEFLVSSDLDLNSNSPKISPITNEKKTYEIDVLEIKKKKEVYMKELEKNFDKLLECYSEKENPFSGLIPNILFEAIRSYKERLYNGAVILCRSAIDSSIYLACSWVRNNQDDGNLVMRDPPPFQTEKDVHWKELKEKAIELKFLNECELADINKKVRGLGNFAAHIAHNQQKDRIEWAKENIITMKALIEMSLNGKTIPPTMYPRGYKLHTSINEASFAIEETIEFLITLTKKYNNIMQ